jgi:hypothetical protein
VRLTRARIAKRRADPVHTGAETARDISSDCHLALRLARPERQAIVDAMLGLRAGAEQEPLPIGTDPKARSTEPQRPPLKPYSDERVPPSGLQPRLASSLSRTSTCAPRSSATPAVILATSPVLERAGCRQNCFGTPLCPLGRAQPDVAVVGAYRALRPDRARARGAAAVHWRRTAGRLAGLEPAPGAGHGQAARRGADPLPYHEAAAHCSAAP